MQRALVLVALGASGCRIGFEARAAPDADTDAAIDAAADADGADAMIEPVEPALCGMAAGTWMITAPVPLTAVNDALIAQAPPMDRSEFDPVFSQDGLTLWFTSDQTQRFVVWRATRPSIDTEFDLVELLGADVNAAMNLHFGFQALDSGVAIIGAPYAGEQGGGDFWLGTLGTTWMWAPTSLSTPDSDGDARLSATGLEVFLARGVARDERDIYRATRTDIVSDFGAASPLAAVNTPLSDSSPVPAPDDAGLFVVANEVPASLDDDVYYSERVGAGSYAAPFRLAALRSAAFDGEPTMVERPGGCEVVFVSDRDGAFNLYRAYVQPRP